MAHRFSATRLQPFAGLMFRFVAFFTARVARDDPDSFLRFASRTETFQLADFARWRNRVTVMPAVGESCQCAATSLCRYEPFANILDMLKSKNHTQIMSTTMKKIGLIGGLSWVSTAEYYRRLNEITQAVFGGVSSARIAMESVNRQQYVEAVIDRGDESAACAQILDAVKGVERAGADFVVISCNDVHRFVPEIEPQTSIPFLHIAEPTAAAIKARGLSAVSLLGVRKTMEGQFYPEIFTKHGIKTVLPNEAERAYVHDRIYDELVLDRFTNETRNGYLEIIGRLNERGAEGVVLACTEIPLLLSAEQISVPSFSTTELHCQAAVAAAGEE